jgi:ABC-type cobalamin/Fe3+-siderophores transport system ATPase subunit
MISQNNIISSILKAPLKKGRRFVAIVGPPASGKSTLAKELQRQIPRFLRCTNGWIPPIK